MSNTRQAGYYWIRGDEWRVAYWIGNGQGWVVCGQEGQYRDEHWVKINETRILAPDEVEKNNNEPHN